MTPAQEQPRGLRAAMTVAGACVVLLHLFGAFNPSPLNWGFHTLAFLPLLARIAILLAMTAVLLPSVQHAVVKWMSVLAARIDRIASPLLPLALAGSLALFWFARQRFFLLGDGTLVVRLVKQITSPENVPTSFPHEPLPGFLLWKSYQACSALGFLPTEEFPIQLVSILCGALAVILVWALARTLVAATLDRLLLGLFLLAGGTSQLFFGYVENYAPLAAGFLLFILLSLRYVEGKGHLALPAMAFGLLFTLHFSMLAMTPALGVLLHASMRRQRWAEMPSALFSMLAVTLGVLWLCGYSVQSFSEILSQAGTHLLPLARVTLPQEAYTMFSTTHAAELGNLAMLLSPFALLIPLILIAGGRGRASFGASVWLFLLAIAGGGIAFAFVVNLDLGMSRDWDVLATYGLGPVLLAGMLVLGTIQDRAFTHRLMVMALGLTLLPTSGWIAVNANEERALARFQTLPDLHVWGRKAVTAAYEELAVYYRRRIEPGKAIAYFRKYIAIDSANGRIWSGLANIYRLTSDTQNEMLAYEKAVACRSTIIEVYLNLSAIYANQGRLDDAMAVAKAGVEMYPASAIANNNYGAIMLRKELPCATTLPYFLNAIQLDPEYADAYYNAGLCSYELNDLSSARRYLNRFLGMTPDAESAALARGLLNQMNSP